MIVTCRTCGENFKKRKRQNPGYCFCSRKCFSNQIKILVKCENCERMIEQKYDKKLCGTCYKRNYKKLNPDKNEKERIRQLHKTRIRKGLPLDHPYLIARPGEGCRESNGYRSIYRPGHHNRKNKSGRLLEHTWVMSQHLGRPLFPGENVHHKNGDRLDNRIENLELWNKNQPSGQRVEDKIKFYKEFLEQYGYEVKKRC